MAVSGLVLACAVLFCLQASPVAAFGAGNIGSTSAIEGQNFRHGDIEDTLLTILVSAAAGGEKFSKLDVKRVYFGNWLRDYSQAVDVGTLKNVSADAIRILLWVLGFLTFGYGSNEFEVTKERLGCYRPEEHIDNPKDYADNEDATHYDRRLRKPIQDKELEIDGETGLKNYIANERIGIDTSAGLVRKLLTKSIELGRKYAREKRKEDWCEALRLLGTACHCMEDFSAHSNYTELCLIEMGEEDVFPHVGRDTAIDLPNCGRKYPLVTGTFGGTDFLHSVCGEVTDKATQSEIEELEGTFENATQEGASTSLLQEILTKLPSGLLGGGDKAEEAKQLQQNAQNNAEKAQQVSPREAEEWTRYLDQISKEQLLPVMKFHDEIMQKVTTTIDELPILPELLEQLQDALNVFIFSLIAPFVLPVVKQVKAELQTGSSQIIERAKEQQHAVFENADDSNPSHSMLSKDHFTNILNGVAGQVACQVLSWAVPQVIQCFDDNNKDANGTVDKIIRSVFHHPAMRGNDEGRKKMFEVVRQWWENKDDSEKRDFRDQLSKEGVLEGRNHKQGEHDTGHGSRKPLGMAKLGPGSSGRGGGRGHGSGGQAPTGIVGGVDVGKKVEEATGGGLIGAIAGGLAGQFTKAFQQVGSEKEGEAQSSAAGRYQGQQQSSRRDDDDDNSGRRQEYGSSRRDDDDNERRQTSGRQEYGSSRRDDNESSGYGGSRRDDNESSGYGSRRDNESSGYGSGRRDDDNERSSGYGSSRRDDNESSGYGGRRDDNESSSYSRRNDDDNSSYGQRSSRRDDDSSSYGQQSRRDDDNSSYGQRSRRDDDDNERSSGYGGGGQRGDYIREDTGNRSRRDDEEGERLQESYGRMQVSSGGDEGRIRRGEYGEEGDREAYGQRRTGQYAERQEGGEYGRESESYGRRDRDY